MQHARLRGEACSAEWSAEWSAERSASCGDRESWRQARWQPWGRGRRSGLRQALSADARIRERDSRPRRRATARHCATGARHASHAYGSTLTLAARRAGALRAAAAGGHSHDVRPRARGGPLLARAVAVYGARMPKCAAGPTAAPYLAMRMCYSSTRSAVRRCAGPLSHGHEDASRRLACSYFRPFHAADACGSENVRPCRHGSAQSNHCKRQHDLHTR